MKNDTVIYDINFSKKKKGLKEKSPLMKYMEDELIKLKELVMKSIKKGNPNFNEEITEETLKSMGITTGSKSLDDGCKVWVEQNGERISEKIVICKMPDWYYIDK